MMIDDHDDIIDIGNLIPGDVFFELGLHKLNEQKKPKASCCET